MRPCNVSLRRLLDHEFPHGGAGGGFHLQQVEAAGQAGGLQYRFRSAWRQDPYRFPEGIEQGDALYGLLFTADGQPVADRVGVVCITENI